MRRVITFKRAGDSITIGGQRFDAGNMTPAIYDGLIAIDKNHSEHFNVTDADEGGGGEEAFMIKKEKETKATK